MYSLHKGVYRKFLNNEKTLVLQMWGAAHGLLKCSFFYLFSLVLHTEPLVSVSPHPASAIDYLGHCQREIRIRLTVSWLMLNQEKTQMMPVYLKEEVSLHTENDIFAFYVSLLFIMPITNTGAAPDPPAALEPAAEPNKAFCMGN